MNKKYQAFLYDLDGTLLDSFPDLIHTIKSTLAPLEVTNDEEIRNKVSFGGKAMMKIAIQKRLNKKESAQKLQQFLNSYYDSKWQFSCLFEGISELINHHQTCQQKWAIVSNKKHQPTKAIAAKFNLNADFVLGRGYLKHSKPHPEPLFFACKQLKVNPEDCLFIGDHQNDILAAQKANMDCALVSWGYIANISELIALNPNYIIHHPKELIQ